MRISAFVFRPLLIAALLGMAGCEKEADPLSAAQSFFAQIAAGKLQRAYEGTAFGFQAAEDEKGFESVVRGLDLLNYASLQSETPKIEGTSATMNVTITTRTGKRLPFVVVMTKETGAWRIFTIHSPRDPLTGIAENPFTPLGKPAALTESPLSPPPTDADARRAVQEKLEALNKAVARVGNSAPAAVIAQPVMPDEKEVQRLVRQSLVAFDHAVEIGSFKEFYQTVSVNWRSELKEEQLEKAFQPFIERKFRLQGIAEAETVFNQPPAINEEHLLVVSGYCPTKPYRTVFSLKYMYEKPEWKLFGLDVNLQQ